MPFKSVKQQRFLEAHPEKVGGKDRLKEWESATDFSSLPEKKGAWRIAAEKRANVRTR